MSVETCMIVNIPGSPGATGAAGAAGAAGTSAFTTLTAQLTMPAEQANVVATVGSTAWMVAGMLVFIGKSGSAAKGTFEVVSISNATTVTLKNLEDTAASAYTDNSAPGTIFPVASSVVAAGQQGPSGSAAAGVLLAANNLSDLVTPATARTNLGLGTMAVQNAASVAITGGAIAGITDLAVADGGTGASNAANARTNLGLEIGTNVQAYDALLQAIAALVTAADQTIYSTGVDTVGMTPLTAFARTLLDDTTAAAARSTLGVLPGYGLLASVTAWDVNSATTDTAMTVASARYIIDKITVDNASTNLTTATGGVFTAAGGGGTTIAADQALSALTASTKFDDLTLQAVAGTDVFTAGTLYARCGTAQGGAATCNIRVWGWKLD